MHSPKFLIPWIPLVAAFLSAFITPFVVEHAKFRLGKLSPDEKRVKNCQEDLEAERKARAAADARADKLEERNAKLRDELDECDEYRRAYTDHLFDCSVLRDAHGKVQAAVQAKKQKPK